MARSQREKLNCGSRAEDRRSGGCILLAPMESKRIRSSRIYLLSIQADRKSGTVMQDLVLARFFRVIAQSGRAIAHSHGIDRSVG